MYYLFYSMYYVHIIIGKQVTIKLYNIKIRYCGQYGYIISQIHSSEHARREMWTIWLSFMKFYFFNVYFFSQREWPQTVFLGTGIAFMLNTVNWAFFLDTKSRACYFLLLCAHCLFPNNPFNMVLFKSRSCYPMLFGGNKVSVHLMKFSVVIPSWNRILWLGYGLTLEYKYLKLCHIDQRMRFIFTQ